MQETWDLGSIPGSGRSSGGGHGNPLQYACLENPLDKGAWWATVHKVAKSQIWLKQLSKYPQNKREKNSLSNSRLTFWFWTKHLWVFCVFCFLIIMKDFQCMHTWTHMCTHTHTEFQPHNLVTMRWSSSCSPQPHIIFLTEAEEVVESQTSEAFSNF